MQDSLPEEISTPRLLVRVARPGDGETFNQAVTESLDRLRPWLGWVTPAPTLAVSEFSCRRAYARFLLNEDLMAFFFLKDTGQLVGGSGLHNANWDLRQFEVGYWGHSKFIGQGYVTEGVQALVNHALVYLRASRVFLTTDAMNVASRRLAERVGFQLEGMLRSERRNLVGGLRDTCIYAMLGIDSESPL
jgi:RimJ/RimL family protein N-acetyltransferase